jgi:hypothetical protein
MLETGREGAVRTRNLMREVNQRAVQRFQLAGDDEIDLFCECGDVACFETATVTPSCYRELCASGAFLVAPGHRALVVGERRDRLPRLSPASSGTELLYDVCSQPDGSNSRSAHSGHKTKSSSSLSSSSDAR